MQVYKIILLLSFWFACAFSYAAQITEGVVHMSDQRAVYYQQVEAKPGMPTVVMLNGLIYSIENWKQYIEELSSKGYGVVLVAYSTQPESLRFLKKAPYYEDIKIGPSGYMYHKGLETKDLADDVLAVVDSLGLDEFHLQTLSYGSIVGSYLATNHAERLKSITLVTPAVMSAHRYTPYGESRHQHYVWQNQININPFVIPDHFYDLELYQTLKLVMEFQRKTLDTSEISFDRFVNGVFQMGRSSKYFDLKDFASKKWPQMNLILASEEEFMLLKDQMNFWREKKQTSSDSRMILVQDAPHAIPGTNPKALADIYSQILEGKVVAGEHTYEISQSAWNDAAAPEVIINSCAFYLGKNNSSLGSSSSSLGFSKSL